MSRVTRLGASAAFVTTIAIACEPIEGTSRSTAPRNECPAFACDAYPAGRTQAKCTKTGACESQGFPDQFVIAVAVPDSSFLSPGYTFIIPSDDLLHAKPPFSSTTCTPPTCLALPSLGEANGAYFVKNVAGMGIQIEDNASIPLRVAFAPQITPGVEATSIGLPAAMLFASSRLFNDDAIRYEQALPVGKYLRMSYPEPPFDELFPPILDAITIPSGTLTDEFTLTTSQLDDPSGGTRTAFLSRASGLDGFRVWLADSKTKRRVSTIRSLHGTSVATRLDTVRQSAAGTTALRDGISMVVAPPDTWIAVPRFETELIGGSGLGSEVVPILYPEIPIPRSVNGVVASSGVDGKLLGIPSRVTFTSTTLAIVGDKKDELLHYDTAVSTDTSGRFATVLPEGTYDITIEPVEGTGFSKTKKTVELGASQLILDPPHRSVATGRAILSDGRPLASATILAVPANPTTSSAVTPRGGRTITGIDGTFRLELDLGSYAISVVPEAGTGFARTVTIRPINAEEAPLGDLIVPPPARLSFSIKAFNVKDTSRSQPIANAFVRIFGDATAAGSGASLVEIGRTTTDDTGKCEILLAQQPR